MTARKLFNELVFVLGMDSTLVTSVTAAGATFDRYNGGNPAHDFVALIDVGAWTNGVVTFYLEESADNSAWTTVDASQSQSRVADDGDGVATAVADGSTVVIDGATEDNGRYLIGYLGFKRYVRVATTDTSLDETSLAGAIVWYVGGNVRDAYVSA